MSFNPDDIEKMFAEAANASEDTGEGDVGGKLTVKKNEKPQQVNPTKESKIEKNTEPERTEDRKEPAKEIKKQAESQAKKKTSQSTSNKQTGTSNKNQNTKEPRSPLVSGKLMSTEGITENSISKILEMNKNFHGLNDTEQKFVSGYFQIEKDSNSISKVIYAALTASQRDLDALNKIVTARERTAAERAFYLMELDNNSIEAIYEQVELLTGPLGEINGVDSGNKINICRTIEKTIAEMPNDVFIYISKLQAFTNIAIEK